MSDILRLPVHDAAPRSLRQPDAVLDAATAAAVDRAIAAARDEAYANGRADGRAEASAHLEQLRQCIATTGDELRSELHSQRGDAVAANIELAQRLATAVLGRTPPDEPAQILERVRAALTFLDAEDIEVALHPDDHALLSTDDPPAGMRFIIGADLAPGDARVTIPNGGAELSRAALLDAAVAVLAEDAG